MFARVITAQVGDGGFDELVGLTERQLAETRLRPGFEGFYLLTDDDTGKLITISFWATREEMEGVAQGTAAGIHDEGAEAAGITAQRLETYEVKMRI